MSDSFHGSCLCGAVAYHAEGELLRFYHCHCSRCRKASGSGHATNLIVKRARLDWRRGEDALVRYRVPEAERFYTLFCRYCGSPLPRDVPELEAIVIPAGSLDHEIPHMPQARIFHGSRAGWSCAGDDLSVFEEYPE